MGTAEAGTWFSLCRALGAVPGSEEPAWKARALLAQALRLLRQAPASPVALVLLGMSAESTREVTHRRMKTPMTLHGLCHQAACVECK